MYIVLERDEGLVASSMKVMWMPKMSNLSHEWCVGPPSKEGEELKHVKPIRTRGRSIRPHIYKTRSSISSLCASAMEDVPKIERYCVHIAEIDDGLICVC